MKRMGTFLKYTLWVIAFFIFSNFLIEVGLNSNYKKKVYFQWIDKDKDKFE